MNYTYYMFAFFVFILIAAVVFLNDRLRRARLDQEEAIRAKEKKLFQLYQNLEEMVGGMEEYSQETRDEIKKDRQAVAAMVEKVERIRGDIEESMAAPRPRTPRGAKEPEARMPAGAPAARQRTAGAKKGVSKAVMVQKLMEKGYSEERIAQELMLSRGEVSLIMGLNKNE